MIVRSTRSRVTREANAMLIDRESCKWMIPLAICEFVFVREYEHVNMNLMNPDHLPPLPKDTYPCKTKQHPNNYKCLIKCY